MDFYEKTCLFRGKIYCLSLNILYKTGGFRIVNFPKVQSMWVHFKTMIIIIVQFSVLNRKLLLLEKPARFFNSCKVPVLVFNRLFQMLICRFFCLFVFKSLDNFQAPQLNNNVVHLHKWAAKKGWLSGLSPSSFTEESNTNKCSRLEMHSSKFPLQRPHPPLNLITLI